MSHVITAPERMSGPRPWVFLAGGIAACPEWQRDAIELLRHEGGTLLNPRRADFPTGDPGATETQITWEFYALAAADIFSMWFCNAPSDQPICMYELGRHMAPKIVLGIEPGYRREADVRIQTALALGSRQHISTTLREHATQIIRALDDAGEE